MRIQDYRREYKCGSGSTALIRIILNLLEKSREGMRWLMYFSASNPDQDIGTELTRIVEGGDEVAHVLFRLQP